MRHPPIKRPTPEEFAAMQARANTARDARKRRQASAQSGTAVSTSGIVIGPPAKEFTAAWSEVRLLCPVVAGDPPYQWLDYGEFGQSVAENWVCDGHPTGQVGCEREAFGATLMQLDVLNAGLRVCPHASP